MTRSSSGGVRPEIIASRSPGPSFPAQPAAFTFSVSFQFIEVFNQDYARTPIRSRINSPDYLYNGPLTF